MLTSLLGIEQQNQAMLKSIQQSVVELVKVQKGGEKAEAKRANDAAREARRNNQVYTHRCPDQSYCTGACTIMYSAMRATICR